MSEPNSDPVVVPIDTAPAKLDPESLALRSAPARAIRFKRGAIIGIASVGAIGLMATAWVALRSGNLHMVVGPDGDAVAAKAPAEAVTALPGTYADVPKLGPQLPGDLGRGILDQQRASVVQPVNAATAQATAAQQAVLQQKEQQASEVKAARQSGLLFQSGGRTDAIAATAVPVAAATPAATASVTLDPEHDPNAQARKADFVARNDTASDVNAARLTPAASPNMLSAGSVISASLITGLRSDIPGMVIAQVTEQVYDSATGSILLIPQGARLIGTYDSVVAFGQSRALVVWQRILLPNGSSIKLDNVSASDASGYAGLADKVDFHTWALLKGVAISTLLGVGANITFSNESDLVQAIRQSTQQSVSRAGDQITSRNLQVQPTITIRPGASVRLIVHRDLILAPWRG